MSIALSSCLRSWCAALLAGLELLPPGLPGGSEAASGQDVLPARGHRSPPLSQPVWPRARAAALGPGRKEPPVPTPDHHGNQWVGPGGGGSATGGGVRGRDCSSMPSSGGECLVLMVRARFAGGEIWCWVLFPFLQALFSLP